MPTKNYGAYKLMISREYKYSETPKGDKGRRKIDLLFLGLFCFPSFGILFGNLYFIDFMDRPFSFLLE